jgi:hypothetical protein
MKKLLPKCTVEYVRLSDIIIPRDIAESKPSKKKVEEYTKRYIKLGYIDVPITVYPETNERGRPNKLILVDGYIRWRICRDWNEDLVPVKYIDINDIVIE